MIWVRELKCGVTTGVLNGFTTREDANGFIAARREARDSDPVWSAYKAGGYDWELSTRLTDLRRTVRGIDCGTVWLCQCCLLVTANGECCADSEHGGDGIAPLSDIDGARFNVSLGMLASEHHEECDVFITGDHNAAECDCERREFSTSRCDGCGSWLAGERHAATLWREVQRFTRPLLPA